MTALGGGAGVGLYPFSKEKIINSDKGGDSLGLAAI